MTSIELPNDGDCRGLADYHVHSTASCDGRVRATDYIGKAIALGLRELGFAEHADFDPRDPSSHYFNEECYRVELAAARAVAGDCLAIRAALEVNYQRTLDAEIRRFLTDKELDYCLGSVHLLEDEAGWCNVSEPGGTPAYFGAREKRVAYGQYWTELRAATASGLFDLLGHFDLIKRYAIAAYGPFQPEEFADEIRDILRLAVEKGVGLEINASGWRQPPQEPYPGLTILRWYRELGGEILTLGSDVHWLLHLSYGLPQAAEVARAAGFRAVALFEKKQLRWLDLPE